VTSHVCEWLDEQYKARPLSEHQATDLVRRGLVTLAIVVHQREVDQREVDQPVMACWSR
jgi:hypothetical protein